MKKTAAILVAIIMMISVSAVLAQGKGDSGSQRDRKPPRGRGEMGKGGPGAGRPAGSLIDRFISNPKIVEKLGLSEEQVSRLKSSSEEAKETLTRLQSDMREAGKKQAEQMTADEIDESAVMAAVEEAGRIRTEMAKIHVSQLMMLRKMLTPEQHKELKKVMQHRKPGKGDKPHGREGDDADSGRRKHEGGDEDMERRREEMRDKMAERRKERLKGLQNRERE